MTPGESFLPGGSHWLLGVNDWESLAPIGVNDWESLAPRVSDWGVIDKGSHSLL